MNIEQNQQEILNIIDALSFYKQYGIKPKFSRMIDEQLLNISNQLKKQKIEVLCNNEIESKYSLGNIMKYENKDCMIVGTSNEEGFIKIAICDNNNFKIIDIPYVLLS